MPSFARGHIRATIHAARNAADNVERGRALEDLICLAFLSVPGILPPIRNIVDFANAGEMDVFFPNKRPNNGLWFLPISILVECKNWQNAVGSTEVRVFIDRLRERACEAGILVAANGITGDGADLDAAHRHIARALEGGVHVLVITLDELEGLRNGAKLVELLLQRWIRLKTFLTSLG
ncbi:MAG: restriction endonuclease [Candidatus Acidiferrales bacterium]